MHGGSGGRLYFLQETVKNGWETEKIGLTSPRPLVLQVPNQDRCRAVDVPRAVQLTAMQCGAGRRGIERGDGGVFVDCFAIK